MRIMMTLLTMMMMHTRVWLRKPMLQLRLRQGVSRVRTWKAPKSACSSIRPII